MIRVSENMIRHISLVVILFAICLQCLNAPQPGQEHRGDMKKAIAFMTKSDRELNKLTTIASYALWDWKVNITKSNLKIKEKAVQEAFEYSRKVYLAARKFQWKAFKGRNSTLFRWFQIAARGQGIIDPSSLYDGQKEEATPYSTMIEIWGKAEVCPPKGSNKECFIGSHNVTKIFAKSRDPEELKHYWLEYRKQTGEKYRDIFIEATKRENNEAKQFGYKTKAKFNMDLYEDRDFVQNVANEMKRLLPLYKQIHAFVRKKLMKHYKNVIIKRDGPIPAHLLGDLYAQKWQNIFDIVKPYQNSSGFLNVDKAMRQKKMQEIDMFIMAEKFFKSIGMQTMTPRFWYNSLIKKPEDRDVDCHASAHNFNSRRDFRIKMCATITTDDLEVIHHEMGHIEYYMHYNRLPFLFRDSANPGFHEAIGDAISLSVLTPSYLRQVGLLKRNEMKQNYQFKINYLMTMALRYVVSVPYAYIIDNWRNKVYEGLIKNKDLNKKYWQNRFQYQGVCPPTKRTEKNFDIGAKWHIAGGVEYFRYYVANILQFQIHKILCMEAGHKGPLHQCNIYKNKKAGKAFAKFLSQGKSRHWKNQLRSFSGGKYRKLDVSAMLEYFRPLMNWLKKENAKEYIGWKSKDPMSCPGDKESTDTPGSDGTESGTDDSDTTSSDRESTVETNPFTDTTVSSREGTDETFPDEYLTGSGGEDTFETDLDTDTTGFSRDVSDETAQTNTVSYTDAEKILHKFYK